MSVSHVKNLTQGSTTDTTMVNPNDWNSAHNQLFNLVGNTSNVSSVTGTDVQLGAGNNITLIGTGSTVSIMAGGGRNSYIAANPPNGITNTGQNGTFCIQPIMADGMIIDRALHFVSFSQATTTAAATRGATMTMNVGLYTLNGGTALSLVTSGSKSYSFSFTSTTGTSTNTGLKMMSVPLAATMDGQYFIGMNIITAVSAVTVSQLYGVTSTSYQYAGEVNVISAASNQLIIGLGSYSVSTTAPPTSIALSQLVGTAFMRSSPVILLASGTA